MWSFTVKSVTVYDDRKRINKKITESNITHNFILIKNKSTTIPSALCRKKQH